jgi:vanillate O-demethylase ferredoxin subunit
MTEGQDERDADVIVDGLWRQKKSPVVRLVAENGETLPGWQPGAHTGRASALGLFASTLTGWGRKLSYLRRARNGVTRRFAHIQDAAPGAEAVYLLPRNLFPLNQADRVVLLAAGIGITPLYAMASSA